MLTTNWRASEVRQLVKCRPRLVGVGGAVPLDVGYSATEPDDRWGYLTLTPRETLRPSTRYQLRLAREAVEDSFVGRIFLLEPGSGGVSRFWWTTSDEVDNEPPTWDEAPAIVTGRRRPGLYEGAVDSEVTLAVPVRGERLQVVVELTGVDASGQTTRAVRWLPLNDGKIRIRDSECDAFSRQLQTGWRYQVWLTAVDLAGNRARAPSALELRVPEPPPQRAFDVTVELLPDLAVAVRSSVRYPESAKRARISGEVGLSLQVLPDGTVDQVDVVKGLPLGLSEAAVAALNAWVFAATDDNSVRELRARVRFTIVEPVYDGDWSP